jgi:hypothetical protein
MIEVIAIRTDHSMPEKIGEIDTTECGVERGFRSHTHVHLTDEAERQLTAILGHGPWPDFHFICRDEGIVGCALDQRDAPGGGCTIRFERVVPVAWPRSA